MISEYVSGGDLSFQMKFHA